MGKLTKTTGKSSVIFQAPLLPVTIQFFPNKPFEKADQAQSQLPPVTSSPTPQELVAMEWDSIFLWLPSALTRLAENVDTSDGLGNKYNQWLVRMLEPCVQNQRAGAIPGDTSSKEKVELLTKAPVTVSINQLSTNPKGGQDGVGYRDVEHEPLKEKTHQIYDLARWRENDTVVKYLDVVGHYDRMRSRSVRSLLVTCCF